MFRLRAFQNCLTLGQMIPKKCLIYIDLTKTNLKDVISKVDIQSV